MTYNAILFAEYNGGVRRSRAAYEERLLEIERAEKEKADRAEAALQRKLAAQRKRHRAYRAGNPAPVRELHPHGTDAAYIRHKRYGEDACEPCLEAHRIRSERWREHARERKNAGV